MLNKKKWCKELRQILLKKGFDMAIIEAVIRKAIKDKLHEKISPGEVWEYKT